MTARTCAAVVAALCLLGFAACASRANETTVGEVADARCPDWMRSVDYGDGCVRDEPQELSEPAAPSSTTTAAPTTTTTTAPPTTTTLPEPVVVYEVIGQGGALVTYATDGFSQEQRDVTLPWRHEVRGNVPEYPVLVAQLHGSGDITCKIWGGGRLPMVEATSSGPYVVVTCSAP